MKSKSPYIPADNSFYAVNREVLLQTLEESKLEYSIDMGTFCIHHGVRYRKAIVIVENYDKTPDALSGIWFNESSGE